MLGLLGSAACTVASGTSNRASREGRRFIEKWVLGKDCLPECRKVIIDTFAQFSFDFYTYLFPYRIVAESLSASVTDECRNQKDKRQPYEYVSCKILHCLKHPIVSV